MPVPNVYGIVHTVYMQADAGTKQAMNAVGGIGVVANTILAIWAVLQFFKNNSAKQLQVLSSKVTQGKTLSVAMTKKLDAALQTIIKNL